MKVIILLFMLSIGCLVHGQVASDYYNKPNQELYASVSQESTFVHKAGVLPCFKSVVQWAYKNREKYNFLSVAHIDSFGIVRITSRIDCQSLVSNVRPGAVTDCNLILTSCTNSLKIGFADLKSRDCGYLWRVSISKELVRLVSTLPDSIATVVSKAPHMSRGVDCSKSIDSIFEAIKLDSIRVADSVASATKSVSVPDTDTTTVNLAAPQMALDSIILLVSVDSVEERKQASVIFKRQLNLNDKKLSFETKIACLEFLIARKLRPLDLMERYLVVLKKLCSDKQAMYWAARVVVLPEQKYKCFRYLKCAQEECGTVQRLIDKIAFDREAYTIVPR
jgi:hypothetical protein